MKRHLLPPSSLSLSLFDRTSRAVVLLTCLPDCFALISTLIATMPSSVRSLFPPAVLSSLFAAHAEAAGLTSNPSVQTPGEVRFDPLGIAAVLTNPRASSSAARLYMQPDHGNFRWPHMLQIGCALPPISILVQKLTESSGSAYPAVDMCLQNVDELHFTSNMESEFTRFLVDRSNQWLKSALSFPASENPATDMKIVHITKMDGTGVYSNEETGSSPSPTLGVRLGKMSISILEFLMGAIVMICTLVSLLIGDIWGFSLFLTYALHWLVCTLISLNRLVEPNKHLPILPDNEIKYALYRRPIGGVIIFKVPKHILERWARTQWVFNDSAWAKTIHWFWVLTGSATAFTSLGCMANMSGYLQLAFLGMLAYASVAEIILTTLARALQMNHLESRGVGQTYEVINKRKWFHSVIETSLGANEECRVSKFDWMKFGLLPKYKVFEAMLTTIHSLNDEPSPSIADARRFFYMILNQGATDRDRNLKDPIWAEIDRVWTERLTAQKKKL